MIFNASPEPLVSSLIIPIDKVVTYDQPYSKIGIRKASKLLIEVSFRPS